MIGRLLALWPHPPVLHRLGRAYALVSVLEGGVLVLLVPILEALLAPVADTAEAARWLGVLAVMGAAYVAAHWRARRIGYATSATIMRDLQHGAGDHLARLPLGWFKAGQAGRIARTMTQSTVQAAGTASHVWPDLVSAFVTPATVVAVTLLIDWRIAMAFLVAVPIAALVLRAAGPVLRDSQATLDLASAEAASRAIEFAQAQPVLRSTGRAHSGYARLEHALDEQRHRFRRALAAGTRPLLAFMGVVEVGFAVVLVVGVWLAVRGSLDVPEAVALLVLASRFAEPLGLVITRYGALRASEVALDRVREILGAAPQPEPSAPTRPTGTAVALEDVTFAYGRQRVLDRVTIRVARGTTTALVGPSGSGKTTVARLIARFWDVEGGSVTIGGVDVRRMAAQDVMDRIAPVFQDAYLFDATIEENVRLGRPNATRDELERAAARARLDEVIDRLPDGWATRVGEGGTALSGGERQRVAIARALLKDAPIVLLDEATSSLDPASQTAVQAAVEELVGASARTCVVIAHRLSTVVGADNIVVLDGGRVAESGRHDELLARDGRYAELWREQAQARSWRIAHSSQA